MYNKARFSILLTAALLLLFAAAVLPALAYEPPPGVLGPDDVDFGGKTVHLYTWDGTHFDRQFGTNGRAGHARIQIAEELFNVNLEFHTNWEIIDVFWERVLTGEAEYDWYRTQSTHPKFTFWNLVGQDALYPISDLVGQAYYDSLDVQDRNSAETMSFEGVSYGYGSTYGPWSEFVILTMYNEDILRREGLPDPYELWLAGEWTWEAMAEIAKAATKDTTGDGQIDQWGLGWNGVSNWRLEQMAFHLAQANGADLTRVEDGRIVFTYDEEPALQAMEQVRVWHNEDRIIGGGIFEHGKVAIAPWELLIWAGRQSERLYDDLGETARFVPLPWGPNQTKDVFPVHEAENFTLPITVAEPEKMLALHSFLWQKNDHETFDEYLINPPLARRRGDAEVLRLASENLSASPSMKPFAAPHLQAQFVHIIGDDLPPASALAAIKPVIQAEIDEVFGQE